jgi:hypothetical protein
MREADLQSVLTTLFRRFPELVGFCVLESDDDLTLAAVETYPCNESAAELMPEIAAPLMELMDEDPQARELLGGRTFARTLH